MDRYERVERVDYKSARDIVTEVDHLSEELIIDGDPGALSRTTRSSPRSPGAHATGSGEAPTSGTGRVWIIDPVDGTINYANGIPFFCVSLGLAVDGRPAAGVVLDPTRNELFAATADGPATLNDRPIKASEKDKLTDFVIQMSLSGRVRGDAGPGRPEGDPDLAVDGLVGAGTRLRRERPVRRLHPAGRHVELGHRGGRPHRRAGGSDRDEHRRRRLVRHRRGRRGRSAPWRPRPRTTRGSSS